MIGLIMRIASDHLKAKSFSQGRREGGGEVGGRGRGGRMRIILNGRS